MADLAESERLEDVFQDKIVTAFASIPDFKMFARSKDGLCLEETEIEHIIHDNRHSAQEQKIQMLQEWRTRNGANATSTRIQQIVEKYKQKQMAKDGDESTEDIGATEADGDLCFGEASTATFKTELVDHSRKKRNPVKKYKHPRPAFKETEKYKETLEKLEAGSKVVHIYGMSGNGKSQIVRAVCKKLEENEDPYIIWHVQCGGGSSLQEEWIKLTQELKVGGHISQKETDEISTDIGRKQFKKFSQKLANLSTPVLLVVEDVPTADREIFQTLIMNLFSIRKSERQDNTVQVLIATQKKDSVFSAADLDAMPEYQTIRIRGFTKKEAEEFLSTSLPVNDQNKLSKLAEALAYSPLQLTLAKAYCKEYHKSYESYYDSLGTNERVVAKEKELLEFHPELGKFHGYEVIMKAVKPKHEGENLQFKVIQMMSFIGNEDVPDILLGRFFQQSKRMDVDEEWDNVNYLSRRLETDCDATIHEFPGLKYGEELLSVHMDILNAVRLDMTLRERRETLIKVLHAMISVANKDNRFRSDSNLLFRLTKHIDRVVFLASELLKCEFDVNKLKYEDFEIQMCFSYLYELIGFISTEYLERTKDRSYHESLRFLWDIVCTNTGSTIFGFLTSKPKKYIFDYEPGKDAKKTAKKAYKQMKIAVKKVPEDFVEKYYSTFHPVTKNLLEGLKVRFGKKRIDLASLESEMSKNRCLTEEQITMLRENNALLHPKQLKKVFLPECAASILHSRGRQGLTNKTMMTGKEKKRYEWYTDVGLELTKVMSDDTSIKTTFEHTIEANNKLPRLQYALANESDEEFAARLSTARKTAQNLLTADHDYYEHGIYKPMSGVSYTNLNIMRYIVKTNTKLYKRPRVAKTDLDLGLKECDELYRLAKANLAKFPVASSCMIQVGRYYACVKKFDKAFEAFEMAFDNEKAGIDFQKKRQLYAWALYNTGRALCEGGREISNGTARKIEFQRKYKLLNETEAKEMKVSAELKTRLDGIKDRVDETEIAG